MENKKIAIAYVPVLHQGYLTYIQELAEKGIQELFLVSDDILSSHEELDYINRKDRIRAVPHDVMLSVLQKCTSIQVTSLTLTAILKLHDENVRIYTPREDINEFIIETYFGGYSVVYENVFLRYHKNNLGDDKKPDGIEISLSTFEKEVVQQVCLEAEKSSDWWRQVGAAIVKDDTVIAIAHNEHMPDEELPNIYGDTRSLFKKGDHINYVTSAHAEAAAIAYAAKHGISTEGATLITTDFPCPYCARVVAKSGIAKIYYQKGYDVLGGGQFFKDMGIEIFQIAEQ